MQTIHSDSSVELGHPDVFAEHIHADGIDRVSLAEVFRSPLGFAVQDIQDIREAEQKLREARETLNELEKSYTQNDCHDTAVHKAVLETIGSISAWTSIFMPLVPQTKETIVLTVILGGVGKIATDTANAMGADEAYQRCQRCNADIAQQQNKVLAAQERYEAEVKQVFGVYTQSVRRKQATETRIRDWKSYAYKLEVYRHQLDPSTPRPTVPVYGFQATPVPAERVMRLGADMLQQWVRANGL